MVYLTVVHQCFRSWSSPQTQINYALFWKTSRKSVIDVNVIPGKEIAKDHHLLVCDLLADITPPARPQLRRTISSLAWELGASTSHRLNQREYQRLPSQRRPPTNLAAVGQKWSGESWSIACWKLLKMCVGLPKTLVAKRDIVASSSRQIVIEKWR